MKTNVKNKEPRDSSSFGKRWKQNMMRAPEVALYISFAALSVVFALSVAAAPILSVGGFILAGVFGLLATNEILKFFKFTQACASVNQDTDNRVSLENELFIKVANDFYDDDKTNTSTSAVKGKSKTRWRGIYANISEYFSLKRPGIFKILSFVLLGASLMLFCAFLLMAPASWPFLGVLAGLGPAVKIGAIGAIIVGTIFL